jgi:hypothetical protein
VLIVVVFIVEPHGLVGLGSRLRVVTTSKEASP